jgi:hypothetical protein
MLVPTIIPAIISAISKVAVSVGPMIAKYAPIVMKVIGENLPKVIKVVEEISTATDLLKPNEKIEEFGAKAISSNKTPEDFEHMNDYVDYLRNNVKVDESKLSNNPIDVSVRQVVGIAIVLKGLNKELGTEISLPFLNKVSELGVESKVILEIIKAYSGSELNPDEIEAYIDGKLTLDKTKQHSDNLLTAYQTTYPSMTAQEAEQAVMKDF